MVKSRQIFARPAKAISPPKTNTSNPTLEPSNQYLPTYKLTCKVERHIVCHASQTGSEGHAKLQPSQSPPVEPPNYQIRVEGHLGCQWIDWFENMTIHREANGETTVTGPVVDQAALHGLLTKVLNLGLPLISITRMLPNDPDW